MLPTEGGGHGEGVVAVSADRGPLSTRHKAALVCRGQNDPRAAQVTSSCAPVRGTLSLHPLPRGCCAQFGCLTVTLFLTPRLLVPCTWRGARELPWQPELEAFPCPSC